MQRIETNRQRKHAKPGEIGAEWRAQVTSSVRTKEQDDREMEEARRLQAKFDAEDKKARAEREAADAK